MAKPDTTNGSEPVPPPAPPKQSFEPHTLEFLVDRDIVATVSFRCRDGAEWGTDTLSRLIMALEMQRSFLSGKTPDVGVSISTPRPTGVQEALMLNAPPTPRSIEETKQ